MLQRRGSNVTYLGLKAVMGVFLASSFYLLPFLLVAILEFASLKTSAILKAGRLWSQMF